MRRWLVLAALGVAQAADDVAFVETTLSVQGELLDWELVDVDGDETPDLVLAVRDERVDGKRDRALHIHTMTPRGPSPTPVVVPVLSDVIAWAAADVRDEPGRELLFLTRGGAFSYSPTIDRYRGNIRRLARYDSLFDIAPQDELPRWEYVLDVGGPREFVLLPERSGLSLWAPASGGAPSIDDDEATDYERRALFATEDRSGTAYVEPSKNDEVVVRSGGARVSFSTAPDSVILGDELGLFSSLIATDDDYRSPALADVDGDGRRDLILRGKGEVRVHLTTSDGVAEQPSRVETFPEMLRGADELDLSLADVDGDGDVDVVARRTEDEADAFEASTTDFLLLVNDGRRLLPDTPTQVLRFEATRVRGAFDDVDGDGRPDFTVGKVVFPSVAQLVTGGQVTRAGYVYFHDDERVVERRPSVTDEARFDVEELTDAIVQRRLSHDMDGDGVCDLVEVDLLGRVAVRRLRRESHFFGADTWELDGSPWKLFEVPGILGTIAVQDVNGDGLGDILGAASDRLVIQLSRRGADR